MKSMQRFALSGLILIIVIIFMGIQGVEAREKSTVVTIFINRLDEEFGERAGNKVHAMLQKKTEGLYNVMDQSSFKSFSAKISGQKEVPANEQLIDEFSGEDSKINYIVYLELTPFTAGGHYTFFETRSTSQANLVLKILDAKKRTVLFDSNLEATSKEYTASWSIFSTIGAAFSINNHDVALKALDTSLFKAGEAISQFLPL